MRINSMSKIKKIKVRRKNCKEKVVRLLVLDENPHSKGLSFSKSQVLFLDTKWITLYKTRIKRNPVDNNKANIRINKIADQQRHKENGD